MGLARSVEHTMQENIDERGGWLYWLAWAVFTICIAAVVADTLRELRQQWR